VSKNLCWEPTTIVEEQKIFWEPKKSVREKKMGSKKMLLGISHSLSNRRTEKPKYDVWSQGSKIRIFPAMCRL
jgi:hypothetical protein